MSSNITVYFSLELRDGLTGKKNYGHLASQFKNVEYEYNDDGSRDMNNWLTLTKSLGNTNTVVSIIAGDPIAETKFGKFTRPAIEQTNTDTSLEEKLSDRREHTDQRDDELDYSKRQHKRPITEVQHDDFC